MFRSLRKRLDSFIGKTEETVNKKIELTKTTRIKSIVSNKIRLSEGDLEGILWNLQMDLIRSDVAIETAEEILSNLRERLLDREIIKDKLDEFIRGALREVLLEIITPQEDIDFLEFISECEKPCKLIFVGVNGTGKTTTIAKVARYLMRNNLSVVLAAGDTFRAGAIEQISRHAQNLGVNTIKHQKGADAAAVIYDAIEHARSKGIDVVLADTAGRMQTNINLMDELRKITRVNKPHLSIFVGDALTGNDAVDQAKKFNDAIGVDAIILTKMDADAKGGSALSIVNETRRPIIFMGTGQNLEDLEEFDREWFVAEIIGGS